MASCPTNLRLDDVLAVLVDEHGADDLVDVPALTSHAPSLHLAHELIVDGVHTEHFLLATHSTLLSKDAPSTMSLAALGMRAVSSTMTGGLPDRRQCTSCRSSSPRPRPPHRR